MIVYAELAVSYPDPARLEAALSPLNLTRLELPYAAGFVAARAHQVYREAGGPRTSLLPDFLIGAHAAVEALTLITRDPRPYRTYFPSVRLVAPEA